MPYADPDVARAYNRKQQAIYRVRYPGRARANCARSRAKPEVQARQKAYDQRPDIREMKWVKYIWKVHHVTAEDYFAMLKQQGGHCALCDRTPDRERFGKLHIDHCHKTHAIRGLLCMTHNQTLGKLGDDEAGLLKALEYMRHPWRT